MAEKRMFAKTIIDSDPFIDMPLSSQALYFHLSMRADDDGFINNPKRIQKMIGAADDDLKILIAKRYVLAFESGVIVIKHWKMHNCIQLDRYKPTVYQDEKALLGVKKNKSYTLNLETKCIQDGNNLDTQIRLDKIRLDKYSIDNICETSPPKNKFIPPTLEEVFQYCFERKNNVDAEKWIDYYTSNGWMVGRNKMKDWKAAVRTWEKNNNIKPTKNKSASFEDIE